jgi:multiple sugar transport system substrate-binding protein
MILHAMHGIEQGEHNMTIQTRRGTPAAGIAASSACGDQSSRGKPSVGRRSLVRSAAALAVGPLAAACAGSQGGAPASQNAGPPVTVDLGVRGVVGFKELYDAAAADFNAKQSKVRMQLWLNEPDYFVKLVAAFVGGQGPDVAYTPSRNLLPYFSQGFAGEITKGLASRKVKTTDWYPLAAQEWQESGKQFGVPQGWGTGVMGINKTLFKNAGVDLKPDFDVTWTHDDFLKMVKQVAHTGGDGNLDRSGIDGWEEWTYWWNFGAEFLSADKSKCTVNTTQGVAGLQWLYDLAWSHRVMPRPKPNDPSPGAWNQGQVGLAQNGGPFVLAAGWDKLPFEADVVLYPIGPGGRHHRFYSDGYIMWTGSKKPDGALDVLAYLGTDGQDVIEKAGGRSIPPYKPVAEGNFLKHPISSGTNGATFTKKKWIDAINGAKLQPLVVPFDDMAKVVSDNKAAVLAGTVSPKQAIETIERDVNALLAKSPMPK